MEEKEKITFNSEDFEKVWQEELKDADAVDKKAITEADKEYARGFYFALDCLETAISNATDIVDEETDTLTKIKTEIIEQAGEKIKEDMEYKFYDVITSILESHIK
jgi:hypothetical protein